MYDTWAQYKTCTDWTVTVWRIVLVPVTFVFIINLLVIFDSYFFRYAPSLLFTKIEFGELILIGDALMKILSKVTISIMIWFQFDFLVNTLK